MTKFKVGEIVKLNKIENAFGEESHRSRMPMMVRIRSIEGDGDNKVYDYGVETPEGEWISSVYEKNLEEVLTVKVVKRTQIVVSEGNINVRHTTNSKKNRVSFSGFGQSGHIKFENIDKVIELLNKLKEQAK